MIESYVNRNYNFGSFFENGQDVLGKPKFVASGNTNDMKSNEKLSMSWFDNFSVADSHNEKFAESYGVNAGEGNLPDYIVVKGSLGEKLFLPIKLPDAIKINGEFNEDTKEEIHNVISKAFTAIYGIFHEKGFVADVVLSKKHTCYADSIAKFLFDCQGMPKSVNHMYKNEKKKVKALEVSSVVVIDGCTKYAFDNKPYVEIKSTGNNTGVESYLVQAINKNHCDHTASCLREMNFTKTSDSDFAKKIVKTVNKGDAISLIVEEQRRKQRGIKLQNQSKKSVTVWCLGSAGSVSALVVEASLFFGCKNFANALTVPGFVVLAVVFTGFGIFCTYKAYSNSKFNKSLAENGGSGELPKEK